MDKQKEFLTTVRTLLINTNGLIDKETVVKTAKYYMDVAEMLYPSEQKVAEKVAEDKPVNANTMTREELEGYFTDAMEYGKRYTKKDVRTSVNENTRLQKTIIDLMIQRAIEMKVLSYTMRKNERTPKLQLTDICPF